MGKLLVKLGSNPVRELPLSVLLGFLTWVSLLPFLLLAGYALNRHAVSEERSQLSRVTVNAESLAFSVDRGLRSLIETSEVLAGSSHIAEGNLFAFAAHAREAALKAGGEFVLVDEEGRHLVNTAPLHSGVPPAADVERVFQTHRPVVGDLDEALVAEQRVIVTVPVVVDGATRFALSFAPRYGVIADIVRQTYRPEGWFAAVADGTGRIIARSHRHADFFGRLSPSNIIERARGSSGVLETVDLEGRKSVAAYQASRVGNWVVFVWVPEALLASPARQMLGLLIGLVVLTLVVSQIAALVVGRLIDQPAQRLLHAARALGSGRPVSFEPSLMREANIVGRALVEASASTQLVMRELSHRSKNLLSVIQSMARQTGRTAAGIADFQARFELRLASLARSHDLLVERNWQGVCLKDLVAKQIEPFVDPCDERIEASGPPVLLTPTASQAIGMALHELATNASKHGALVMPAGRITVAWTVRPDPDGVRLELRWQETGGPSVAPPVRKGFGHTVLERVAKGGLAATVNFDWKPEGLIWTMSAPAGGVVEFCKA